MSKTIKTIIIAVIIFFSGFILGCQSQKINEKNDDPFNNLEPEYVENKKNPVIILTCLIKKSYLG